MIEMKSGCVHCGLPCLGRSCPNYEIPVFYCDECGDEIDGDLYEFEDEHFCESCLLGKFRVK